MGNGFHFDLNKCVGCHACVVACQIENGKDQYVPWREINTFNSYQHPDLPVFHFSMACNHCEEAPCMNSCPALAYTRDLDKGTIVHHANRCIGCSYCTWACPYDAPKFVQQNGVVEKCTSCQHRVEENEKPACANLCPTGALDYKPIHVKRQSRISGFTEADIGAGLEVIELRRRKSPVRIQKLTKQEEKQFYKNEFKVPSKISLRKEWVLVLFSLMVPVMTALLASASLGKIQTDTVLWLGLGLAGFVLSTVHLGKKQRAWRAILNIKNSWLSREILSYSFFLGLGITWFVYPQYSYIGYAGVLVGFATSYFIDKVYRVTEKTTALEIHSANVFLTALLFTSLLTENYRFTLIILGIKFLLYIYRKIYFALKRKPIGLLFSIVRISFGFIAPIFVWSHLQLSIWEFIFIFLMLGELTDRIEFYLECEVISPKRQMITDAMKMLNP